MKTETTCSKRKPRGGGLLGCKQKPRGGHPQDTALTLAAGLSSAPEYRREALSFLHLGPRRRPKAMRAALGPSQVTLRTPIGSKGPYRAGGQAPPIHRVTKSQQGEFKAIPRLKEH